MQVGAAGIFHISSSLPTAAREGVFDQSDDSAETVALSGVWMQPEGREPRAVYLVRLMRWPQINHLQTAPG